MRSENLRQRALLVTTILAGTWASGSTAWASQATGCSPPDPASSGTVVCSPAGNIYTNGIRYLPTADINLTIQSGVQITGAGGGTNAAIGVGPTPPNPLAPVNITLNNAGTITLLSTSLLGIGSGVRGTHALQITNSGAITAGEAIAATAEADAAGTGNGRITINNSGDLAVIDGLTAVAGQNTAYATATVSVTNSGILSGRQPVYALEDGIDAEAYTGLTGTSTVNATNSGQISTIETGIVVAGQGGTFNATVSNQGSVAATTQAATAIVVDPRSIDGLITVTNDASGVVTADGRAGVAMLVNSRRFQSNGNYVSPSSADVTVENAGEISVTGDAAAPQQSAALLIATGGLGTLNNKGTITAANARAAVAIAPESLVELAQGASDGSLKASERTELNNSGTIRNTTGSAVLVGDQPTYITNSGTIATGVANGVAIGLGSGSNFLTLTPTSDIEGRVINGIASQIVIQPGADVNIASPVPAAGSTVTVGFNNVLRVAGSGSATFDLGQLAPTPAQLGYTPVNGGAQYRTTNYAPDAVHQYQGFSAFEKDGDSAWTLTGTTDFAGPTTVSAGLLVVNGSLAQSATSLASGAFLSGSGTVGSLVADGTVAPSYLDFYVTLHVNGDVTFNPGSNLQVVINAAGQTDSVAATGTATINGGTVNVIAGTGTYKTGQTYRILTAAAGRTGTFSNLVTSTNLAFLTPSLTYSATEVDLVLARATTNPGTGTEPGTTPGTGSNSGSGGTPGAPVTFASAAASANQRAAANAIEAVGSGALFDAVLNQTAAGARAAFDAASGEVHASAATAAVEGTRLSRDAIFDRLETASREGSGALGAVSGFGALAPTLPAGVRNYAPVHMGYDRPAVALQAPAYTAWGSGFGDFGSNGGNGNAATLDRSLGGFVLGVDTRVDWASFANWHIGVAGGFTGDDVRVRDRASSGTVETYFGGLYAGAQYGAVDIKLGALGGGLSTDLKRTVAVGGFLDRVRSRADGAIAQGFGEIGYKFALASGFIEPLIQGAAIHVDQDAFREKGGAAALIGADRDTDVQTTTLAVRAEAVVPFGGLPLIAQALLGWRHAFGDVDPRATLAFAAGGPTFAIAGAPIDDDAVVAQVGLKGTIARNMTLGVSYTGQAGRRAEDNGINGRLEYRF